MPGAPRTLLGDVADGRDNNFDVLRLLAATMVLVSHAYPLTDSSEPLARIGGPTLGGLGVALFFGMSGFLITKSWTRQPDVRAFARKRARRILPALWIATTLTVLVLGPVVTTRRVVDYLTDIEPWTYLLRCFAVVTFDGRLPGVFEQNPYPDAVNGSLWTLPLEVTAYGLVVVLGIAGILASRRAVLVVAALAVFATALLQHTAAAEPAALFGYFAVGATLYRLRAGIRLSRIAAAVVLAAWIVSFDTPLLAPVGAVALPYALMVVAYRTPAVLRRVCAFGDVSYGMYIYAFPIQQTVLLAEPSISPLASIGVALPLTWLAGLLSWRLVEAPALRRARPAERRPHPAGSDPVGALHT